MDQNEQLKRDKIKEWKTFKDFQNNRFHDKLSLMSFKEMRLCI